MKHFYHVVWLLGAFMVGFCLAQHWWLNAVIWIPTLVMGWIFYRQELRREHRHG